MKGDFDILSKVLEEALEDFPQEWWVENFVNPGAAYRRASDLLAELKAKL